jgi:hypothetical protein
MDIESAASQHTQYAEKHGRGSRASREGDGQANRTGEHAGHEKKDTVEISDDGRRAAMQIGEMELNSDQLSQVRVQIDALKQLKRDYIETPNCMNSPLSNSIVEPASSLYIYRALAGKVEGASDTSMANALNSMLFSHDPNLETRTADREAGKNMAKYIAENYFDNREEAQAFMDTINKLAEISEALDKGYVISMQAYKDARNTENYGTNLSDEDKLSISSSVIFDIKLEVPEPPKPPSDFDRWLEKKEYTDLFNNSRDPKEILKIMNEYKEEISDYEKANPESSISKPWESSFLSWEMSCDPKYSMFSEENKTLYEALHEEFLEKAQLTQTTIDNAKLTTDVSSNEKWNAFMNLLGVKL